MALNSSSLRKQQQKVFRANDLQTIYYIKKTSNRLSFDSKEFLNYCCIDLPRLPSEFDPK